MLKRCVLIICLLSSLFFISCNSLGYDPDIRQYDDYVPRYSFGEEVPLEKGNDSQFTLAVIPDIQSYTHQKWQTERNRKYPLNQFEILNRQMEYVAKYSEKNGGPIAFAVVLGDLVNDFTWYPYEWKKADEGLSILDGEVPLQIIIGNHDYDHQVFQKEGGYFVKGAKTYNKYFGPKSKYFKDKDWFGGASDSGLSTYCVINCGGQDFVYLGLEMIPSDEEMAWAESIVQKYSNLPVILSTHSYISTRKESPTSSNAAYTGFAYKALEGNNGPQDIFNKLVYPNKNILFVLCGHSFNGDNSENTRLDYNKDGYPVYTILTDYQSRRELYKALKLPGEAQECGDGWLRFMNFDMAKKQVHCVTYSTEFNTFETDENSDFIIKFDFDWDARFN